jgi:hypothetical protein
VVDDLDYTGDGTHELENLIPNKARAHRAAQAHLSVAPNPHQDRPIGCAQRIEIPQDSLDFRGQIEHDIRARQGNSH